MLKFAPRLFSLLLLLTCGCGREEPIHQYTVEKPRKANEATGLAGGADAKAWFFKLNGPADAVGDRVMQFAELIRSVTLQSGEPVFDLPPGWERQSGNAMRYATLVIPDTDPALEVAVSSLPYAAEMGDQYELANLNRWRGQLGLDALQGADWRTQAEDHKELLEFPSQEGRILLVHLVGETKDFGNTRMLAAMFLPTSSKETSAAPPAMSDIPVRTAPAPFQYTLPEGWEVASGNSVRLASFKATTDDGVVDVSVTRFPGGGGMLDNINRWRGQVKLEPIDEAELEKSMSPIDVGGIASQLAEIVGLEQSILVVTVPEGESKWFFKAQGPAKAIAAQRAAFLSLMESVTFEAKAAE